jgi:hypothetical protein
MKELFNSIGNESLSVIRNPFDGNRIKKIYIFYQEELFNSGQWHAFGGIEFQNGKTTGEQKFDGKTFDDVVHQMKACINQLLKNQ